MSYSPGDLLLTHYRIEALIGRGAFGEVYRARHLALGSLRALKVLRRDTPGLGSTLYGDANQRFRLEAQLGDRLNHPHIVRVYDFSELPEALVLVMEYASGGSLSDRLITARLEGRWLDIQPAVELAAQVAEGLAALHALDAVHRDIKPSNILFDGAGSARLADLGLAQLPGGPSMRSQISDAQPHPGTPGYMSPEQERERGYLRPASDVYALGLVLFEMLTLRNYYQPAAWHAPEISTPRCTRLAGGCPGAYAGA